MQDTQERMKEFQKEYREAQLSQDEKRIKKLDVKRDRMMKEQTATLSAAVQTDGLHPPAYRTNLFLAVIPACHRYQFYRDAIFWR